MRALGRAGACRQRRSSKLLSVCTTFLLLLTLCPVLAVESSHQSYWSSQLSLESHVVVGADGIARTRGAGRTHSDGLSITRSTPVDSAIELDAEVDDQAIKFSPARVDLGRLETCTPNLLSVSIKNRGRVTVRLDGADFTQDGFSMTNDVRGIVLDPGDRFNFQFVFLPSDVAPNGVDAQLRVLTTSGLFVLPITSTEVALHSFGVSGIRASIPAGVRFEQSLPFVNALDYTIKVTEIYALDSFVGLEMRDGSAWIGTRWPRAGDDTDTEKEIPGQYDKNFDYKRRVNRGPWDLPANTTSPLVKVSLESQKPGVYLTYIHVAAGNQRLMLVPVRITVLKPGIHIEPKELDLGILTEQDEIEPREVFLTLFNADSNPIDILDLKILESNMIVSAQLRGSTTIAPLSRAYDVLSVQLRVDKQSKDRDCFASLMLKTNASSMELGQRKLRIFGKVLRGQLGFHHNETLMGIILPLADVFEKSENGPEEYDEANEIGDYQEMPHSRLVSIIDGNASNGLLADTSEIRTLQLWNLFDRPVELQRVWIPFVGSNEDTPQEVALHKYKQSVALAGAAWPKISLQITPTQNGKTILPAIRSYPLMVETNATLHHIQIFLYHNILTLGSTRGLQSYSVSGYYARSAVKSKEQKSSRTCLTVPRDGFIPSSKPRLDRGQGPADTHSVKICRSLLFDLGKVASHKARAETVAVTNMNPVPITLHITSLAESDIMGMNISATVLLANRTTYGPLIAESNKKNQARRKLKSSDKNSSNISLGDSFVLQPGYQVVFQVEILAKESLGNFTVPVLSFSTPVEVVHLYARSRIIQGTVEPVAPAIVLPSMFPGRTEIIHLQYRNTFAHSVTAVTATLSSPKLKLLSMRNAMGPKKVESVLALLFSPAADAKCSNALFLADCLLPAPLKAKESDQTCEQLSDYGELVDAHDLAALSRRDAFWNARGGSHKSQVEAQVHLQTDILDDVAGVTIMAQLERPLVTATANMPLLLSNDSLSAYTEKEFSLTEVLGLSHLFVEVHNPSNISVQMELTMAEVDRDSFYFCDQETTARDSWGRLDKSDASTMVDQDISALCLAEWKSAASNAVSKLHSRQVNVDVPSFYFRRRIVRVLAGEKAQLGPIYYLPSKVQEMATTVFVRNDLSHIEPVRLLARSGKGMLDISVDLSKDESSAATTRFDIQNTAFGGETEGYDGALSFAVTENDALTGYSRGAEIVLSNTGPFGLTIHGVTLKADVQEAWISPAQRKKQSIPPNDFTVTSDLFNVGAGRNRREDGQFDSVVLPSGATARLQVSFFCGCYSATTTSWLIIDTSDSVKRIRLEGTITPAVAFLCLHARVSPSLRYALGPVWMVTIAVAVASLLYSLWMIVLDVWSPSPTNEKHRSFLSVDSGMNRTNKNTGDDSKLRAPLSLEDNSRQEQTIASISSRLEEFERLSFAAPARVVTPAVAALLERRHKGLFSTVQTPGHNEVTSERHGQKESVDKHASPAVSSAEPSSKDKPKVVEEGSKPAASEETDGWVDVGDAAGTVPTVRGALGPDHSSDLSSEEEDLAESLHLSSGPSSSSTVAPADDLLASLSGLHDTHSKHLMSSALLVPAPAKSKAASPQNQAEPYDPFESFTARWRAQDWHEKWTDRLMFGRASSDDDWEGALSSLGSRLSGNQRGEDAGSRSAQHGSDSYVGGTGSSFLLEGFSGFESSLSTRAVPSTTRKAPPGFTPADAKPLETRAAFDRLRGSKSGGGDTNSIAAANVTSSSDTFGGSSAFASQLPLFGPALPPPSRDRALLDGAGRIGSGRSKVLRAEEQGGGDTRTSRANLGGRTPLPHSTSRKNRGEGSR